MRPKNLSNNVNIPLLDQKERQFRKMCLRYADP